MQYVCEYTLEEPAMDTRWVCYADAKTMLWACGRHAMDVRGVCHRMHDGNASMLRKCARAQRMCHRYATDVPRNMLQACKWICDGLQIVWYGLVKSIPRICNVYATDIRWMCCLGMPVDCGRATDVPSMCHRCALRMPWTRQMTCH